MSTTTSTTTAPALGSVVVPAHDEAAVIGHTLRCLTDGLDLARTRVVVACNGCTDDTVDVVRALGLGVEVLDLATAGKAAAIAAAESLGLPLPRLYVDADVGLTGSAATSLLEALSTGAVAGRPRVELDVVGATWPVRHYARCRQALMEGQHELWGAGAYGLSATARQRFASFPEVIADDLFAARIVRPDEVRVLDVAPVRVRLPRTTGALVTTLARVHRGNAELSRLHPGLAPRSTRSTLRRLASLSTTPANWLDVATFAALTAGGRVLARRTSPRWERDETTRAPAVGSGVHR
jgi:glycosyltransferase involved in cell wall biosynthesis